MDRQNKITTVLNAIAGESSDEDIIIPLMQPPSPTAIIPEANLEVGVLLLGETMKIVENAKKAKIEDYIETVVYQYIDKDFIMHFPLSRAVVNQLLGKFENCNEYLSLRQQGGYQVLSAEKYVLAYLWFLGHESAGFRDVADRFGISLSSLHRIIKKVSNFLVSLAPSVIKHPSAIEIEETTQYFFEKKGFPGIVGAINGSHVRIDMPSVDKQSYVNRHKYFSLHLQGVVNHTYKFIDVFVGYPGSVHDARVWKESPLGNNISGLCSAGTYLIGDSAYPCLKNLIVPYRDNGHLTRAQKNFNTRLSSCRIVIEHAFGQLNQRFRQLYHLKLRNIPQMVNVIYSACILQNLANTDDLDQFEAPFENNLPDVEAENLQVNVEEEIMHESGRDLRDDLCRQLAVNIA